jgi:hypothetical protein
MTPYLRRLAGSISFRPVLTVYVGAVIDAWAVASGYVRTEVGVLLLGFVAVMVLLSGMRREVATVHKLVNSQHDALVDRVDQLLDALETAGVSIPDSTTKGAHR